MSSVLRPAAWCHRPDSGGVTRDARAWRRRRWACSCAAAGRGAGAAARPTTAQDPAGRPGRAPVCSPPSITIVPLTVTIPMPAGYWCGSSQVDRSMIVTGVDQDHVGRLAAQEAAVFEAERRRSSWRRLRQGEQAEVVSMVADEPRERAVETRMRFLGGDARGRHAGPVGADRGGRVGGDGAEAGFRHRHRDAVVHLSAMMGSQTASSGSQRAASSASTRARSCKSWTTTPPPSRAGRGAGCVQGWDRLPGRCNLPR